MDYRLLTEDEQHEMLAATLEGQERDHYSHSINLERYETMLASLAKAHPEREAHEQAVAAVFRDHAEPHPGDTARRTKGEVLNPCQTCQFIYHMRWLHEDTITRLLEVRHIMDALEPQLPPADKLAAAHARNLAKRQP